MNERIGLPITQSKITTKHDCYVKLTAKLSHANPLLAFGVTMCLDQFSLLEDNIIILPNTAQMYK